MEQCDTLSPGVTCIDMVRPHDNALVLVPLYQADTRRYSLSLETPPMSLYLRRPSF